MSNQAEFPDVIQFLTLSLYIGIAQIPAVKKSEIDKMMKTFQTKPIQTAPS